MGTSITLVQLREAMSDNRSHPETKPSTAPAPKQPVPANPAGSVKTDERPAPDPTRYGDWEKNGRCIVCAR